MEIDEIVLSFSVSSLKNLPLIFVFLSGSDADLGHGWTVEVQEHNQQLLQRSPWNSGSIRCHVSFTQFYWLWFY